MIPYDVNQEEEKDLFDEEQTPPEASQPAKIPQPEPGEPGQDDPMEMFPEEPVPLHDPIGTTKK